MSAGVMDGEEREAPQHVRHHLAQDGPADIAQAARVPAEAAVLRNQEGEARAGMRAPAPDRIELGRGVEAGFIGLDDPEKAVAVEVAVRAQPLVVSRDRGLGPRFADRDPPRPREERRLDRRGRVHAAGGDVVVEAAPEAHRSLPEGDVADEAVLTPGAKQRLQLATGPGRVKPPPDDRREA